MIGISSSRNSLIFYVSKHLTLIYRSLTRDNKHTVEKEQVIKLIRTIVEVGTVRMATSGGSGVVPLSEPVMRAFIAVAEHAEDPFRPICIQTLAEISALVSSYP